MRSLPVVEGDREEGGDGRERHAHHEGLHLHAKDGKGEAKG